MVVFLLKELPGSYNSCFLYIVFFKDFALEYFYDYERNHIYIYIYMCARARFFLSTS